MTTPVAVYMIVAPGTHINTSPEYAVLSQDPQNPTPNCTTITAIGNATTFHGTYSTSSCTSVVFLTSTEYLDLCSKLLTGTVRVDFQYDSSASGTTKPLVAAPTFTVVTEDLFGGSLAHILKVVDERVTSGVSSDLRTDIKFIRKAVEELLSRR